MTARVYRLTEIHQRIDDALKTAAMRRDARAQTRLMLLKNRVKLLLHRVMSGRRR